MIDQIHIEQLAVQAHIGVPPDERSRPQRLVLNVTLWPRAVEPRDELVATINYSEVARLVREFVSRHRYKLIETLAEKIAAELVAQFAVGKVVVEVRKFVLADAEYVSVTAVREAQTTRS